MAIKFKSRHSKYALLDCFGHVPARCWLTNNGYVDVGRFSYSAIKTFLMFNNGNFEGLLASIGDFCEFARESRVLLGGEHKNNQLNNFVLSASPPVQYLARRAGCDTRHGRKGLVTIGDGCIVSYRATILSGAAVGDGCVVGAGAIVSGNLERFGIYAGTPARRLAERRIEQSGFETLRQLDAIGVTQMLAGKNFPSGNYVRRSTEDRLLMIIKYEDSHGEGGDYQFRILGALVAGKNYPLKEGTEFHKYALQATAGCESDEFEWEVDPLGLEME